MSATTDSLPVLWSPPVAPAARVRPWTESEWWVTPIGVLRKQRKARQRAVRRAGHREGS